MDEHQEKIRSKGFNIDYKQIKIGKKTLEDAVLNLGSLKQLKRAYLNKNVIMRALAEKDIFALKEISNFFYNTNGIYRQICDYCAFMYRYDWYIVPQVNDDSIKEEKVLKEFNSLLNYLDSSHVQKVCGDIALTVIKNGAYYGYIVPSDDKLILQELPTSYCRSRYSVGNTPAIEFNLKFFDEQFGDINQRMRILKMFPDEFSKAYIAFKQGKLNKDFTDDTYGWYLLDPKSTIKFNINNSDVPLFVTAIPALLDLDAAQDLDRRKQMQQLLKILIQQLPLDKNGDLIFDIDEARDIHNNAVEMLQNAIGVDVLTTFANVSVEDMADSNTSTTKDDLEKIERTVYNTIGVSKNIFNTDGNLSLEKSILQDESKLRGLLLQFHIFFDRIIYERSSNKKKFNFRFYMLETTQYNYKDMAKMYKEQVQIGYSKMLPQIAMGHSQSSIIHTAYFENEVLKLSEIMIPPLMSSTMSSQDVLGKKSSTNQNQNQNTTEKISTEEKTAGRPEKEDSQKSEKTIQNRESMS